MTEGAALRAYNLLRRQLGRAAIIPAPDLPASWLPVTTLKLSPDLLRGLLRLRHLVFLGAHVRLRSRQTVSWGSGCRIGRGSDVDGYARRGVVFGPGSRLGDYSTVTCTSHVSRLGEGFHLGTRSGFGDFCHFGASGGVWIGDNVLGGSYVSFHSQDHVFEDVNRLIRDQGVSESGISVGNDCWIGAKATFLDGAAIGDHCIVAAGTVVRGQYPANSVIGGVPSRLIRTL